MNLSKANLVRVLYFFAFCCQAAWVPRFADYLKGKGFAGFELGLILSITPVMMFLVQPIYGYIADRVGYKKTLLLGAALAGVFFLGHLFFEGFWFIAFITALMSLFFNCTQPIVDSLALRAVDEDPTVSYGSLRIAGAVAWSFMGVVNGQLIDAFTLKIVWIVASVAMFLMFVLALTVPEQPRVAKADSKISADFGEVLSSGQLRWFLLLAVLFAVAQTTIWNFYSLFMKEIGASDSLTGWGFSIQGLAELPLFYFSAAIIGRFGLKKSLIFTLLVTAGRMVLYSSVKNPQLALFIELTHGISWSLFWVACVELTNKLVKDEWKATGQSLLYAAYFGIGMIAGNFWTSFLIEKLALAEIFWLNAGIIVVAAAGVWGLIREAKPV